MFKQTRMNGSLVRSTVTIRPDIMTRFSEVLIEDLAEVDHKSIHPFKNAFFILDYKGLKRDRVCAQPSTPRQCEVLYGEVLRGVNMEKLVGVGCGLYVDIGIEIDVEGRNPLPINVHLPNLISRITQRSNGASILKSGHIDMINLSGEVSGFRASVIGRTDVGATYLQCYTKEKEITYLKDGGYSAKHRSPNQIMTAVSNRKELDYLEKLANAFVTSGDERSFPLRIEMRVPYHSADQAMQHVTFDTVKEFLFYPETTLVA